MIDSTSNQRIAIVGISGLFPGAATLDEYWDNIEAGIDCSQEVPANRWLIPPSEAYASEVGHIDRVYSTRGYFLDEIPLEPEALAIPKQELRQFDASARLAVTLAAQAWKSFQTQPVNRRRVGVILGHIALPTELASHRARAILDSIFTSGVLPNHASDDSHAFRVAGWPAIVAAKSLGLGGCAFTLDAACASSLYAIQMACKELQEGRADAMLAGGLSRPDCQYTQMGFAQLRALAAQRCSPFDASADGLMVGEGGGIFVLKRLDDALNHGDLIHGVITGIGLSNDRAGNLLAPASEGQLRAMQAAYRQAAWSPDDVDLIECHATGTPVGDATEFRSLQSLWANRGRMGQCVIGSVKSTVGHLLTGAGAAGLIKVLLALRRRRLPPTANFHNPSNEVALNTSPFRIVQSSEEWPETIHRPRRAAVSSFGFGGINAHLLVEEFRSNDAAQQSVAGSRNKFIKAPIAIVGLAVHAGSTKTALEFRNRILPPPNCLRPIHAVLGPIEHIDIPLNRFPIPPREFESMLPQQVLALLTAASALGDAGMQELPNPTATGVYLGLVLDPNTTNFHFRWSLDSADRDEVAPLTADRTMGALASIAASRIARALGVGGPSFALSSEETSGATALNLAIRALQRGEVSLAIAGAVELTNDVRIRSTLPDHLQATDASVTLILERLDDAERNGRAVYATIDSVDDDNLPAESDLEVVCRGTSSGSMHHSPTAYEAETGVGFAGAASSLLGIAVACLSDAETSLVSCAGFEGNRASFSLASAPDRKMPSARKDAGQPALRLNVTQVPFELRQRKSSIQQVLAAPRDGPLIVSDQFFAAVVRAQSAVAEAHAEFLRFTAATQSQVAPVLQFAMSGSHESVAFDRHQCLEFARGQIAPVLGYDYAGIDQFRTRVRLPDEPLMLVDRILSIEGEALSLTHGRVVTEHDVTPDRWYLDHNRIPVCIAVEAGQADLFLCSYLGIDYHARGLAVYRLLDAVVTFHADLPAPNSVIQYDIHIDRFFRQGETHLFRFRFVGTVNGKPLLTMTDGCAGFFTDEELAAGKGIVHTELDRRPLPGKVPADWRPLALIENVESYDDAQLNALRVGDLAQCFGEGFAHLPLQAPLRLPGGRMHLVDRITTMDPTGGRFRLGLVRGEADIHADDWFLTCHFVDDMVMPGTLMFECCLHTLRIFLMRLGWVGEHDDLAWQPIPGVPARLRCRGQVVSTTRKVTYEVSVKELGYRPEPFAIADVLMYADGKPIVEMLDMSVRLTGTNRAKLEQMWATRLPPRPSERHDGKSALYDTDRILAFATGNPSEAFGDRYQIFDSDRIIARLPGPPYSFLDRIVEVSGAPWVMEAGASATAEYVLPSNAWYFLSSGRSVLPFAVLLEIALQPCGWLAAYVGSALHSETDLSFRNLGGKATQHQLIRCNAGLLTTRVKLTNVANSGGMIIQHYEFAVSDSQRRPVYTGTTYFGFFSKAALALQVGLRDSGRLVPFPIGARLGFELQRFAPDARWRMIDEISIDTSRVEATKLVNPQEWFFQAHFYQDPVMPGSLGLEALVQSLQSVAQSRWGAPKSDGWQCPGIGQIHEWIYRGQVIPKDRKVTVQAEITKIDDAHRMIQANGILFVDGRPIYRMMDFSLQGWE